MSETGGSQLGTEPSSPNYVRLQRAVDTANRDSFQLAASELQALLASDSLSLPLRRDALAHQALLYLRTDTELHDLKAASIALDELYQLSAEYPEQQHTLLLEALALALENALRLNKLDAQYRDAMTQQSQLQQNVVALEQALEKLRQLSLQ